LTKARIFVEDDDIDVVGVVDVLDVGENVGVGVSDPDASDFCWGGEKGQDRGVDLNCFQQYLLLVLLSTLLLLMLL